MPTIQVVYQETEGGISLAVEPRVLKAGPDPREPVVWQLEGLPPGAFARIEWITQIGGEPPLGPFRELLYGEGFIVGRGDQGHAEARSYSYQVLLESSPHTRPLRSEVCEVAALPAAAHPGTNAVVRYAGGKLEVEPLLIAASTGNIVTWFFEDFPPDVYPVILFRQSAPYGPFSALSLSGLPFLEGAGVRYVITGEVASSAAASWFYTIQARDVDHQILAERHDPGIDNMGPPISTAP